MSLGKQAKVLNKHQINMMLNHLSTTRHPVRNQLIFLLSVKSGLRAKEIASLRWEMLVDATGSIGTSLHLTNDASKGDGGRIVPLNKDVVEFLGILFDTEQDRLGFNITDNVIRTERSKSTSSQAIVNLFSRWYKDLGFVGCSSHSGRRTFITSIAKKISSVGGTLRDVQSLAGHRHLATTQLYIEVDTDCQRKLVDLI